MPRQTVIRTGLAVDVGARLRELREEHELTMDDVAADLGVGKPQLSRWETGSSGVSLERLCDFADYYEVSTDWLLGRSDG